MVNATRDAVLAEKRHVSSKVSDNGRYIGYGLLALYYTLMFSEHGFGADLKLVHPWLIQGIGIFGVLAIICDYLQYMSGYFSVNEALSREDNSYDKNSFAYKARNVCFALKQFAAGVGALLVVFAVGGVALKAI